MKEFALFFLPAAVAVDPEKMPQKVLNSRCVLAVTECARGPSFIPIRRKWEGPRQVGGARCWRRNRPRWRNCGRRRANAWAHDTHMQPRALRVRTWATDLFVFPPPPPPLLLSPVWGTCSRLHTQCTVSVGEMDIHMKAWRLRGAASKTQPQTGAQRKRSPANFSLQHSVNWCKNNNNMFSHHGICVSIRFFLTVLNCQLPRPKAAVLANELHHLVSMRCNIWHVNHAVTHLSCV